MVSVSSSLKRFSTSECDTAHHRTDETLHQSLFVNLQEHIFDFLQVQSHSSTMCPISFYLFCSGNKILYISSNINQRDNMLSKSSRKKAEPTLRSCPLTCPLVYNKTMKCFINYLLAVVYLKVAVDVFNTDRKSVV